MGNTRTIIKEVESPELRRKYENLEKKVQEENENKIKKEKELNQKISSTQNEIDRNRKEIKNLNKKVKNQEVTINKQINSINEKEKEIKEKGEEIQEKNRIIDQKNYIISDIQKQKDYLKSEIRIQSAEKQEFIRNTKLLMKEKNENLMKLEILQSQKEDLENSIKQKEIDKIKKEFELKQKTKELDDKMEISKKLDVIMKEHKEEQEKNEKLSNYAYNELKETEEKVKNEYLKKQYEAIPDVIKFLAIKKNISLDSHITKSFIKTILSNEIINKSLIEQCRNILNGLTLEEGQLQHFNILVFGNEGIGKSTLINTLIGEEKAKTGIGVGVTQEFELFESKILKGYRFWDSKGLSPDYHIIKSLDALKKKIEEINDKKVIDDQIDCLWYCISRERFNNYEFEDFLLPLIEEFNKKIPLIIIYVRATDIKLSKQMVEIVNKTIKDSIEKKNKELTELNKELENMNMPKKELIKNNINIIDILAKDDTFNDKYVVKRRNLDILLKLTNQNIKDGIESSLFKLCKDTYISECNAKLDKNYEEIKNDVQKKVEEISNKNDLNDINQYIKEFQKIFEEIIIKSIKNIVGNIDFNYDFYIKDIIQFENYIIEKLSEKTNELISEKSNTILDNLSEKLLEEQTLIDKKYEYNLKKKLLLKDFRIKYQEEIQKNVELLIVKNYLKYTIPEIYLNIISKFGRHLKKMSEEIYKNNFDITVLMNEKIKTYIHKFVRELSQRIENSPFVQKE